jgi:hypothetical protein
MATTAGNEDTVTNLDAPQGNLVQRVVQWLRAGYPDGVPQQDYVALLGILRRSLTETEVSQVVSELSDHAESGHQLLTRELVEQRIHDVVKGPIDDADVIRVSSRLASAGWPLASPQAGDVPPGDADDSRPGLVGRIVDWLRVGYPAGIPDTDYVPLVALLRRRVSDDDLRSVSRLLSEQGVISADRVDIGTAIVKVTSEMPSDVDIERVRRYLHDHGWPSDFQV